MDIAMKVLERRIEKEGDPSAAAEWRARRPLQERWVFFGAPSPADEIAHAGELALRRAPLAGRLVRLETASSGGPDPHCYVGCSPTGPSGPQLGRLSPPEQPTADPVPGPAEIITELLGAPVGKEAWHNGLRAGAETIWVIPEGMTWTRVHEALLARGFECARWTG